VTEVRRMQLGADDRVQPRLLRTVPEADGAVEAVRVGDRESAEPHLDGAIDEVLRMRGAIEEREVGMGVQLGVRRRTYNPRMPLRGRTLAFLGGGTMAEAMIRGLLERHLVPPSRIRVTGPRRERRAELTKSFGVRALTSNAEAARQAHVVVLSVKPQVLPVVLRDLHGKLRDEQLVLSIVAGANINTLTTGLGHAAVVRSMPNTPAQVGMGVTVWCASPAVDGDRREQARAILGALGEEVFVEDEDLVDMATAVSGTGPTYVFLLMEALVDAAVHLGFSRRVAEELVLQTVEGSAQFARKSGRHLAELRNMVTSPGGTSAAAIYQLEKGGLRTVLSKAIYAAYQRTRELGTLAERRSSS
jgi:pyrroline-5-carboxylate reductase